MDKAIEKRKADRDGGRGCLLADKMGSNGAGVRGAAVFPKVNPLPGAQRHSALANGDGEIDSRQRGPHVSRHIVVPLNRVREQGIAVRHQAGEEMLQVTSHVRVGIFLDEQGGGSVAEVQSHQAAGEPFCKIQSATVPVNS
jgi:hypothetical protein